MALEKKHKPWYANVLRSERINVFRDGATIAGALGSDVNGFLLCTAHATLGSQIKSLLFSTSESAIRNYFVYTLQEDGATLCPIGIVNVPVGSGSTNAIQAVDAFAQLVGLPEDNQGKNYIPLEPGESLKIACLTDMTASTVCWVTALIKDYEAED
jgi:hypothetical protein